MALDQATRQPALDAEFVIMKGRQQIRSEEPRLLQMEDRVILMHTIALEGVDPGRYQVMLQLRDRISGQQASKRANFEIRGD